MEGKPPVKNRLLKRVLENRKLFHFLLRRAYLAQKPLAKGQYLRHLPFFFPRNTNSAACRRSPERPSGTCGNGSIPGWQQPRYRVALFGGCLVDFVYPEQAQALVRLLKDHNVQLEYPMDQTCCGLPAMMMGENETAGEVAIQNLKAIDPASYDFVLTLCASCGSHLKENYPKLLRRG